MKKRLLGALCALALFCAVVLTAAGSSTPTVYLLAVNDVFYDQYLPVSVDGVIYVPYTIFDRNATKMDLGVYSAISKGQGTILTLYGGESTLVFRVTMGVCEDGQGNRMSFRAVNRGPNNNTPYVPAAAVCGYFGLNYSYLPTTDRGILIRISSSSRSMDDQFFLSTATGAMTWRYNNILRSLTPTATAAPTPTATPTPTPRATATPAPEQPGKESVTVYLAVDASDSDSDLWGLFPGSIRALFLFTPDALEAHSDKVRKVVAAGHSIGLIVDGTAEEVGEQLERGNELLAHIARVHTRIVSAPAELTDELTEAGWACWESNVAGITPAAILADLDTRRTVGCVTLPGDTLVISQVLTRIRADGYTIRQPLETELG